MYYPAFICFLLAACSGELFTTQGSGDAASDEAAGSDVGEVDVSEGGIGEDAVAADTDAAASCDTLKFYVGALAVTEIRQVEVDFDTTITPVNSAAIVCLSFRTSNPASARAVGIAGQSIGFGPCSATAPQDVYSCQPFIEPAGVVVVVIENATPGSGCQSGEMTNVIMSFPCEG
jgi:hypothetical protein